MSLSTAVSPTSSIASGGQITSLVITQLNILLSTIKENGYEDKADKIRSLVDEHGMDVFITFFRRLLQINASAIYPSAARASSGVDNAAQYRLLTEELAKVARDPQQVDRIAQSLDTNESELFRDFDLSSFIEHFRLNPIIKVALVLPLRNAIKPDLRSKGAVKVKLKNG